LYIRCRVQSIVDICKAIANALPSGTNVHHEEAE
jgi:hypothetical protein